MSYFPKLYPPSINKNSKLEIRRRELGNSTTQREFEVFVFLLFCVVDPFVFGFGWPFYICFLLTFCTHSSISLTHPTCGLLLESNQWLQLREAASFCVAPSSALRSSEKFGVFGFVSVPNSHKTKIIYLKNRRYYNKWKAPQPKGD